MRHARWTAPASATVSALYIVVATPQRRRRSALARASHGRAACHHHPSRRTHLASPTTATPPGSPPPPPRHATFGRSRVQRKDARRRRHRHEPLSTSSCTHRSPNRRERCGEGGGCTDAIQSRRRTCVALVPSRAEIRPPTLGLRHLEQRGPRAPPLGQRMVRCSQRTYKARTHRLLITG